ncbi:MAG: DUF3365 domain-containing protein [Deltaproteobacteria bacterium]|nr:DUF3365 domain-containing protein [Deltaproteobacteria bacterium]
MRIGVRVKLLIFAAAVWAVIFGAYSAYIYYERIEQTRRMGLNTANILSREISADRQFYSATVVKRALDAGMKVSGSYHSVEKSIPTPAAFLREVSESLGASGGFYVNIVSLSPLNPESGPRDEFQKTALEKFAKGLDTRHYEFTKHKGMESARLIIPDVATSETCVNCHNKAQGGGATKHKIGDVMGGIEIIVPIESELSYAMTEIGHQIVYGFFVVLTMGIAGLIFIRKVVTDPILSLVETTKQLAGGDLTVTSGVSTDDEAGDLGRGTNEVIRNLHGMIEDIREASSAASSISNGVRQMSRHVLEGSNSQGASLDGVGMTMEVTNLAMSGIAKSTDALAVSMERGAASALELGAGINEVVDNMESLFLSVDETALSTKDMSHSVREISDNIGSLSNSVSEVRASMIEINASIKEVELNAAEASRLADGVIRDAKAGLLSVESTINGIMRVKDTTRESTVIMNALVERVKEVGKILDVIRDVAEETNLLALNAAIIASQTGESGKSFSVVANEIKDLAERTSTSAKEVSEIISAVEAESARAVAAMNRGVESVEEGVRLSKDAGAALEKIVTSAQRSNTSVREIARASGEQSRMSRTVVEAMEKVAVMTKRIVNATAEQAKGAELINKATERMADIAFRVKNSTRAQAEANKQITATMEDVNRMVGYVNNVVREQSRNTVSVLGAIEAVRMISVENIEKAKETDKAVERLSDLNRQLTESVKRFKLRQS